jgi:hypothetical protein
MVRAQHAWWVRVGWKFTHDGTYLPRWRRQQFLNAMSDKMFHNMGLSLKFMDMRERTEYYRSLK